MMYSFPGPRRAGSFVLPVIVVLSVVFLGRFVWGLITDEYYDAETILVEFHCPTVLSMKENYPSFVIIECKKLYER
jgi:hypothetical protein